MAGTNREQASAVSSEPAAYEPFIPASSSPKEFTWSAVIVGTLLGILFGASSLYLVLKVGMTVSASIPVAVMSITLFRLFSRMFGVRRATILENNIVQTAGSAGESIAFGVGVTMPALMLLGFEMEIGRVMVVSVLGGVLGILMMIPLRRAFIVKRHGELKYPEGTACADVLIIGEQGGASAKTVFTGFGIAVIYQFLWQALKLWKETPAKALTWFKGAVPAIEVNPALLGVGYIIGLRVAAVMAAGAVLSYLVLVPAIHYFGDGLNDPVAPGTVLIRDMSHSQIRAAYIQYIGAGAVAAGGIISLFRSLPLIFSSLAAGLRDLRAESAGGRGAAALVPRTDRDLSMRFVLFGCLGLIAIIWLMLFLSLPAGMGAILGAVAGAILVVLFGFLFVTVSSRLTGEIGSSSNPISGMTIATLLLTCLIFLVLGMTAPEHRLLALSVAAVVCIAASNGGTTSQDLKTGFLVGATPKYQQWAILIGAVSSALVIGWILIVLNATGTVYTTRNLPTPNQPINVASLAKREKAPNDETLYHVLHIGEGEKNANGLPVGKYLVDDSGKIRYLVDPGVNGRIHRRDDGTEIRKYGAPQAQLMALITGGVLERKLPWTLVLLGVFIALMLELCRVPALPFAVGVYLHFSLSMPIFVGGLLRWLVDRLEARRSGVDHSQVEADMTPGVLFSTGYIAGGAIAGVIITMFAFSDTLPTTLARLQYRSTTLTEATPTAVAYRNIARRELGIAETDEQSVKTDEFKETVAEIEDLNTGAVLPHVVVPAKLSLQLPRNKTYLSTSEQPLGPLVEHLCKEGLLEAEDAKASTLFDLNRERLKPPAVLPAGASLQIPQRELPAVLAFGVLAALLFIAGYGRWFSLGDKGDAKPAASQHA